MKFSVITVCFNAGEKLIESVKKTLLQTYEDFEVVVKDGGSTDGSIEMLQKLNDSRVKIFYKPDKGIYDAMNQAVQVASGDYVIFMNVGDEFYSDSVLTMAAARNLPKENTIAYGDTYFALSDSLSKAPRTITGSVCYRNIPCHQAIFYSRDTLLKRGFDTSLRIRADFEHFAYSFFKANRDFIYLGFPICCYEGGGFSEKKENEKLDKKEYAISVRRNIPFTKRFVYRATLILTLYKVRKRLANNPKTAAFYQKIKSKFI